jgi:hypothetical protein
MSGWSTQTGRPQTWERIAADLAGVPDPAADPDGITLYQAFKSENQSRGDGADRGLGVVLAIYFWGELVM